jgi:hypothetical protein
VGLERDDRPLRPQRRPRVELVVRRGHPDTRVSIKRPSGADQARQPDFGLERPAIRAQVDQFRAVVLTERRDDREAGADDGRPPRARELGESERAPADQVDGQLEPRIGQTGSRGVSRGLADAAGRLRPRYRERRDRKGGTAEKVEGGADPDPQGVHRRANVLDRKRWIDDDAAGRTAGKDGEK